MMKKLLLFFSLIASLSLHASAWGDMADNGLDCTVVMEKTRFDARAAFPDFKLVFANKGKKSVRLLNDFYPFKGRGPNIFIDIWSEGNMKKKDTPIACYMPSYQIERNAALMSYITLQPGEQHEVCIKDVYLLLRGSPLRPFANGERYVMEVSFRDGYGEPGIRRVYVGKKEFSLEDQTPK